jgi:hypothetical protein
MVMMTKVKICHKKTNCLWNDHIMMAGREINYAEPSPSWEGNICSNGQEISSLLTLLLWYLTEVEPASITIQRDIQL